MADEHRAWKRQGEAFWRAHHEAWKRSDLNQRQYCEAQGLPLKAFENWRQKFKAEPQPPERKLLYRRRGLSPPLSPPVSPPLSPGTYPSSHAGQARSFRGRARAIDDGSATPTSAGSSKRPRNPARAPPRWRAAMASLTAFCVDGSRSWRRAPAFVTVQITDADAPVRRRGGTRHDGLLPPGVKVHLALGYIDMRKGIDGLAMLVQGVLQQDPFTGHLFVFRGRTRANLIKIVFWDGTGLCLFTKRLEHGVFLWPPSVEPGETLSLTSAQLSLLIDGVDWRAPEQRWRPAIAG